MKSNEERREIEKKEKEKRGREERKKGQRDREPDRQTEPDKDSDTVRESCRKKRRGNTRQKLPTTPTDSISML